MENKYFLHQIRLTNGAYDKGIVVKDTLQAAKQGYHAYLGAYAYGKDAATTYVSCMVTDMAGNIVKPLTETWIAGETEG